MRWNCKEIAVSRDGRYNGCRNIFFQGRKIKYEEGEKTTFEALAKLNGGYSELIVLADGSTEWIKECECSGHDLIIAPEEEDWLRERNEQLDKGDLRY